jgi:hypothetical protein
MAHPQRSRKDRFVGRDASQHASGCWLEVRDDMFGGLDRVEVSEAS